MSVADIRESLETALAHAIYTGSVSVSQLEQDLNGVTNGLKITQPSIESLPTIEVAIGQFYIVVPKGIHVAVSITRASSALGKLSTPLTPEQGSEILVTLQSIQAQLLLILGIYKANVVAVEAALSGLHAWGFPVLQNLVDVLVQAFAVAAPATISRDVILEIQTSIDSTIQALLSIVSA